MVTSAKELGVSKRTAERVIAEMRSKKGANGKVGRTEVEAVHTKTYAQASIWETGP